MRNQRTSRPIRETKQDRIGERRGEDRRGEAFRSGWSVCVCVCVRSVSRENGRVIKSIAALWPVGVGARPGGSKRERNVYRTDGGTGMMRTRWKGTALELRMASPSFAANR